MEPISNALVVGCSYANGHGLPDGKNNKLIWPNQLLDKLKCKKVNNISTSGWNNESIFHATVDEISVNNYDIVLVEWSAIPRYNIDVGLECYNTKTMLSTNHDITINNKTFSYKKLQKIRDSLLELHNDHWAILRLVQYVNILIKLQVNLNKKNIFFINGIGPWSQDYFQKKNWSFTSELDNYTKFLLSSYTRDDHEIASIYNKIHSDYAAAGGIQETHWLNLYNSLDSMRIDEVSKADSHPGLKSQDLFANYLWTVLKNKCSGSSQSTV